MVSASRQIAPAPTARTAPMAQAAGYRTPRFLTFKQALELGGNMRRGENGTKVYFVKQLQVRDTGPGTRRDRLAVIAPDGARARRSGHKNVLTNWSLI